MLLNSKCVSECSPWTAVTHTVTKNIHMSQFIDTDPAGSHAQGAAGERNYSGVMPLRGTRELHPDHAPEKLQAQPRGREIHDVIPLRSHNLVVISTEKYMGTKVL